MLLPAAGAGEKALLARLERLERQLAGMESGPGETVDPAEPAGRPAAARRAGSGPGRSGDVPGAERPSWP